MTYINKWDPFLLGCDAQINVFNRCFSHYPSLSEKVFLGPVFNAVITSSDHHVKLAC